MHQIEVVLVVSSVNIASPKDTTFLLIDRNGELSLPSRPLRPNESTLEAAAALLEALTGLRARLGNVGWVRLIPAPLADATGRCKLEGERWIAAPFGCILPGDLVELRCSETKWLTFAEIAARGAYLDHLEILTAVANNI